MTVFSHLIRLRELVVEVINVIDGKVVALVLLAVIERLRRARPVHQWNAV